MNIIVVVPARNEAALIARCLRSIDAARLPGTRVIVVADSCTDETAAIARSFAGVEVIEIDAATVGIARRVGIDYALEGATWIATTDADSVVPPNWLSDQVRRARSGTDVVVGTVRPERSDLSDAQVRAWVSRHDPTTPNGHVHGANLGIRASSYVEAGGFHALGEHEDVDLVERLAALGATITAANTAEVLTSGRSVGRTPGGYARYLRTELVSPGSASETLA